ncbi:MAG: D-aminoacylase [Firmicutes bacterium]|nr:D-aminoacylase [Bacillota bacterium]
MYDYILKNGYVVVGDGMKAKIADLAIGDGKIREISEHINKPAKNILDVSGKYVTPGFIDIHRHADVKLFAKDFGELEVRQGLTTIINGNCGLSVVPCPASHKEDIHRFLKPVIGNVPSGVYFDDFSSYRREAELQELPVNVGMLIGNGTIRAAVIGYQTGKLSLEEKERARAYLESSLEAGALGVSLGIVYAPEYNYDLEDFVDVLWPMRRYQVPLLTHIRGEGDTICEALEEVIEIARRLEVPLHVSHLKIIGARNWGTKSEKALEMLTKARASGMEVTYDLYPYTAGSTQLIQILPPEYLEGGLDQITARLQVKEEREALTAILKMPSTHFENLVSSIGWNNIYPTTMHQQQNQLFIGKSIEEIAILQEKDPYECAYDLLIEENCGISMIDYIASEEDIIRIMKDPYSSIISDTVYPEGGLPHPRMYGTFPRILQNYVKEQKVLTIEEAVRKMTSLPAEVFHLSGKGMLKPGMDADINVFDLEKIETKASYREPIHMATGFSYVFVNGVITVCQDQYLGSKAGIFITRRTGGE